MRILIAALALLSAACSPMADAAPDSARPVQTAEASSCATRGGEMRRVGRMQSWQCIIRYADAGKRCTDGDQCAGDCRVAGETHLAEGARSAGVCSADSDRFGCHTTIEDGRATATLCID